MLTSAQSALRQIQQTGIKRGALHTYFVKGHTLGGTISEDSYSSLHAASASSTPLSSVDIDPIATDPASSRSAPTLSAKTGCSISLANGLDAYNKSDPGLSTPSESDSDSESDVESDTTNSEPDLDSASSPGTKSPNMGKGNKKRKADKDLQNKEDQPKKKRKRAVSGNNGALAVPAATIATFEGAASWPKGALPHAQAAGQSQSTGVDGVEPGEFGPNGYLYDPKPQKKPARTQIPKEVRQAQMRAFKKEKRRERKIRNQEKDAEMKRFHKERKQQALLEQLQKEDPEKYANTEAKDIKVQTNAEIRADKKDARVEKKEQKKLLHRTLAKEKKRGEEQLKDDVVHGLNIDEADLSNRKRRMAVRLRARLDRAVAKKGGTISLEEAWDDIEAKRVARKETRKRQKEERQIERKRVKAERAHKAAENRRNRTNWQKEKEDRKRAADLGVPYDPAMTGANSVAFRSLGGQRPLPEFRAPPLEAGAEKLLGLSEVRRSEYEVRAREKGITLEAYAARRVEKKREKNSQVADLP